MPYSRSLPELAHIISTRTNSIYDALESANQSQPSFDFGSLESGRLSTTALEDSRDQLLEAMDELRSLILGPTAHVFFLSFLAPAQAAILHVLYKFNIAKYVPLTGPISYGDLADQCGLLESFTRRYVRAAISLRIFSEPTPDTVQHNAASAALATTTLYDWIGMASEELGPAALQVTTSLQMYPKGDNPAESPFAIANGSRGDKDLFAIVGDSRPERMARFANAMTWSMKVPGMELRYSLDYLGWSSSRDGADGWCPALVVDVGGGTGDLARGLLERYPRLETVIVEDLQEVVSQGEAQVAGNADVRLQFKAYNFFTQQTVANADVYIWRCVLHDWPDSYAIQILQNQIPALKTGARILIIERCLEPPSRLGHVRDQFATACDIHMQLCANAKERTRDDWAELLARANSHFKLSSVVTPPHSALSILEVMWTGAEGLLSGEIS